MGCITQEELLKVVCLLGTVPEGNRVQDRIALTMFRIMARTPKCLLLFLQLFVVFKCLLIVAVAPCFFAMIYASLVD